MLTRRPRAVLFDAGNTLICLDLTAIASMLLEAGVDVPAPALARAEYHGRRAINAAVNGVNPGNDKGRAFTYFSSILDGAGIASERIPALFDTIRAANEKAVLWRIVPPGTHETLKRLRAEGVKVGVVSNADGRVEAQLAAVDLTAHLDFVIDSHRVGVEKPDPRIFKMGLERTGVAPEDALYVGDMYEIDVVGARAAGIPGVLVDPLMLETVDCPRIRTVTELPELFPAG
jgi:putative hydrolase of the HAD superfamily